jgi:hypothetical protein
MTKATPTTRRCGACKVVKPLTDYAADRSRPLGKMYVCKPCDKARAAARQDLRLTPAQLEARFRRLAKQHARLMVLSRLSIAANPEGAPKHGE